MDLDVGQTFGDYSITAVLEGGGAGRLYQVQHRLTKRQEIMKVLFAELATDTEIKRFEREMRALARLNHPNIAALYNAVYSENRLILFMELVEGQTLESLFVAGSIPMDAGINYLRQILAALNYAHQQGVVHRDITPAHVIVTASGDAKLTDFGLSKSFGDTLLTNCGDVLGSLPYLAPEQLKGVTQPDRRSDLYSAGAILYEHLTGQKPFGAKRKLAAAITDSEGQPKPPSQLNRDLAPEWDEILQRALAAEPGRRYQSADEFLAAIEQIGRPTRMSIRMPRMRLAGIGVAICGGLALALAAFPAIQEMRPLPAAPPLHVMHIMPPDFAFVPTPPVVAVEPMAPVSMAKAAHHRIRAIEPPVLPLATSIVSPAPIAFDTPPPPPPLVIETAAPVEAPDAPQPKKSFWNKLNVFKKRKGASEQ